MPKLVTHMVRQKADPNSQVPIKFTLALGATPSMAMYSNFLGRTIEKSRSMYSKIKMNISSSVLGAGRSSGCVQGCIMPFMSKYKLSNSLNEIVDCWLNQFQNQFKNKPESSDSVEWHQPGYWHHSALSCAPQLRQQWSRRIYAKAIGRMPELPY